MSSGCGAWQITLQAPNAKAKSIWPKMAAPQYGLLYCSLASGAQDGPGWPGVRTPICFDLFWSAFRDDLVWWRTSQVDFILPGRLTQLTLQNLHAQLFYLARMGMDQRRLHHYYNISGDVIHTKSQRFFVFIRIFWCLPGYQTWFWHSLPYQKPPPRCMCEWCSH